MKKRILFVVLVLGGLGLIAVAAWGAAAPVSADEAANMSATELASVREALETHVDSPGTGPEARLSLGIVLFRLREFDAARVQLTPLLGTADEALAAYYLARIAEAEGDFAPARQLYSRAADQYDDLEVQRKADDAIVGLMFADEDTGVRRLGGSKNFAFASTRVKSVSGLVDPDDSGLVETTDQSIEAMFAGSLEFWKPDSLSSVRVGANVFREDYVDFSDYDILMVGGSLLYERPFGRHRIGVRLGVSETRLGGEDYLRLADIGVTDALPLNADWELRLGARYRDVTSTNSLYDYYGGHVAELGLGLKGRRTSPWRFDYTYRYEDRADSLVQFTNDAGDLLDGFRSYSRDYHRLRGRYEWRWNERLTQSFDASLRATLYDDPDLYLADPAAAILTEQTRKAWRYTLGTELSWSVSDRFRLLGDIEYLDENANIDLYDFDSLQFGLGLDYIF